MLSLICGAGLAIGKIKIFGISLGATFVFFAGILAGHFGLVVNPDMLIVLQNFGLILFIYALGVQVGPGFFGSLKKGGFKLNMLATLLNKKVAVGNSSIFVGNKEIEVNKKMGRGKHGHIAIGTNSTERAVAYLESQGVKFTDEYKTVKNGKLIAIYLKDEIGGFAVHLVQK